MNEILRLTRYGDEQDDREIDVAVDHIICYEAYVLQNNHGELKPVGTKLWLTGAPSMLVVEEPIEFLRSCFAVKEES